MPPWPNTPAKNRVRDRCLGDDDVVLELLNLARDGHVNVTGTVLAVGDDEAAEEGGVDLGLELDVLGAGHLLDLLGDHELLLVLELDSGGHGGNLMGKGWDRDRQRIVRGWDAIWRILSKELRKREKTFNF